MALLVPVAAWFAPMFVGTAVTEPPAAGSSFPKGDIECASTWEGNKNTSGDAGADDKRTASPGQEPESNPQPCETSAVFLNSGTSSKINRLFQLDPTPAQGPPVHVQAFVQTNPEPEPPAEFPQLKLKGTLAGSPSYAVLTSAGHKKASEWLAMEGTEIQGWRITGIDTDRVSLEKNNRSVILTIIGMEDTDKRAIAGMRAFGPTMRHDGITASAGEAKSEMTQTIEVSRRRILGQAMNLGEVMSKIHLAPYVINRELRGFKLPKVESPFLREMGLRAGDIVLEVDGRRIEGPQSAWALAGTMSSKNEVEVRIKRNGRDRILRYSLGM